jgi:hypothetical protein
MTERSGNNYGNVISGGTFTNANIGGQGSRFSLPRDNEDTSGQLRKLVAELITLINQHAPSLDRPALARRDAEEILAESERSDEDRDSGRLLDALRRLGERLSSVATLAEAVGKVAHVVGKLVG